MASACGVLVLVLVVCLSQDSSHAQCTSNTCMDTSTCSTYTAQTTRLFTQVQAHARELAVVRAELTSTRGQLDTQRASIKLLTSQLEQLKQELISIRSNASGAGGTGVQQPPVNGKCSETYWFGSGLGQVFDDAGFSSNGLITGVVITTSDHHIRGIQVTYGTSTAFFRGSNEGNRYMFSLKEGELITKVEVSHGSLGDHLNSLRFTTSLGKVHGWYGGQAGTTDTAGRKGGYLSYISGRESSYIHRIDLHFTGVPCS